MLVAVKEGYALFDMPLRAVKNYNYIAINFILCSYSRQILRLTSKNLHQLFKNLSWLKIRTWFWRNPEIPELNLKKEMNYSLYRNWINDMKYIYASFDPLQSIYEYMNTSTNFLVYFVLSIKCNVTILVVLAIPKTATKQNIFNNKNNIWGEWQNQNKRSVVVFSFVLSDR